MMRIGQSRDTHRLKPGKWLKIGGLDISSPVETIAHSDGDCLLHAIAEALLGALALGDLGTHFPDTDPTHRNLDSGRMLDTVYRMVKQAGYALVNLDSTVHLEKPKLAPKIDVMRKRVASILEVPVSRVSIKATTGEGLGPIGRGEAVVCDAVVLLERKKGDTHD